MTKVINQDGATLTWVAVYMRYRVERRDDCEDLDDALGTLHFGRDAAELSPTKIILPSGDVIEGDALDEALDDYERRLSGRVIEGG